MLMKKMLAIILVSLVLSGCEKNGSQNDLIINNTEEENVVMDENDDYELKNIEMGRKEEKDISDRLRKMVGKCKRIYSQADKGNASNIVLEEETVHTMIESIAEGWIWIVRCIRYLENIRKNYWKSMEFLRWREVMRPVISQRNS